MDKQQVMQLGAAIKGMTTVEELGFLYDRACAVTVGEWAVELGTYLGRTLAVLAYGALPRALKVLGVDNYSYDEQCSLEKVKANLTAAGLAEPVAAGGIRLIDGDTRQRPVDVDHIGLLFVDSHHTRQQFDAEMSVWLDHVMPQGTVVCHDYDSPTWLEMTGAIQGRFFNSRYQRLGSARRMIAFRKI